MKTYYKLDTNGDYRDKEFCFTSKDPEGIGLQAYKFNYGQRLEGYPTDPFTVTLTVGLDEEHGLKLGSIIGNTSRMLIVNQKMRNVIENYVLNDIEYYPLTILDNNGDELSRDYSIALPIGSYEYLNTEKSDIEYDEDDGSISVIYETVLDISKMDNAPHLFKIKPVTGNYYFSQELRDALIEIDASNLLFREIIAD